MCGEPVVVATDHGRGLEPGYASVGMSALAGAGAGPGGGVRVDRFKG